MSDQPPEQPEFTEEELAQLEAEMQRITVDDVLLQTIVSLINLAARKAGLAAPPGQGPEPEWDQVRLGIEGARALMPLVEPRHGAQLGPIRDGLAQLQLHYARSTGAAGGGGGGAPAPSEPAAPGPAKPAAGDAQRSGRLWIPGQ
jgi:hypothetical protein